MDGESGAGGGLFAEYPCRIDDAIFQRVLQTQGVCFAPLMKVQADKITRDLLAPDKALKQAEVLQRFCRLEGRVLEIGAGLGVNLAVWLRHFGVDGHGVEPDGAGFDSSYAIARQLLCDNDLDPDRIVNATGENLPFPDDHFDIVYSTNVLEHVNDPARVLEEALRVLKPGGTLQIVFPNYHSYFDGHYSVFHPPIFSNAFFQWYVKTIWRRDPGFAATLRTELNPSWVRRTLRQLAGRYRLTLLSMGEGLFLERMTHSNFTPWGGLGIVHTVVNALRRLRVSRLLGRLAVAVDGWTPVVLTIRKG